MTDKAPMAHPEILDALVLGNILRFVVRRIRVIGGATLLALAVGLTYTTFFTHRIFEASAVLVVVTPKISSELKPPTLTIQGYQKLLESDAVIEETKRQLVQKAMLRPGDSFRLKEDLETRIFVSRYSEVTTLAPMVQLVVRSDTPERAAIGANTWAQVFLLRIKELMAGSTASQVSIIEEQFIKSRDRLIKLEEERLQAARGYAQRLAVLTTSWDEKIVVLKAETTALLMNHQVETRLAMEELKAGTNLYALQKQVDAFQKVAFDLQSESASINSQLQQKRTQVEALRQQVAGINPVITLRKSIIDEALWRSLVTAEGKEPDWKMLQEKVLLTQDMNPVYRDLVVRLSQLELEGSALAPRSKQLSDELDSMRAIIKKLSIENGKEEAKLERLLLERKAGLDQLQDRRTMMLEDMKRQQLHEANALFAERDRQLAQLDRGIAQEKELHAELAKNYNQATLAKAQHSLEDVRLGSMAVPLDRSLPRGFLVNSGISLAMGFIIGLMISVIREFSDLLIHRTEKSVS
jgi:capsular polysaccharide biosynthesis protein